MERMSRRRRGRPAAALLPLGAVLVLVALLLAACGGGGGDTSSTEAESTGGESTAAETETTGTPIKAMFITPLQSQATPTYENGKEATIAFEQWTNSHGGINGQPIEISICDDRGEPNQAVACAREGVQEGVVAVIGSFSFFGENIVPVLEKAETAWFGGCCAQSAAELTSPASFMTGSQPAYGAAVVAKGFEEGCEAYNAVIVEGAEALFEPVMENAAKAYGKKIGKFITIPAEAKDESPVVAEALSGGADCVATIFGESLYKAWMPAWAQANTDATMYGAQGNLNAQSLKGFEEAGEGSIIGGIYSDFHTDAWTEYREALDASGANPDLDYGALAPQAAWSGDVAFKAIVEEMEGPIDNKTFLEAASKTSQLETGGLLPVLNFTEEWTDGLEGFNRLFNRYAAFSKYENGEVVPYTDKLYDATELMLGTGKLGAGVSPK